MADGDPWLDEEEDEDDEEGGPDEPEAARHAVLTFTVGGRLFGLSIAQVAEIVALPECVPLPDAPPWLSGVALLRGRVVPLVDLRRRLGLAAAPPGARPCVAVTEGGALPLGLVLDEVRDVMVIPPEWRSPPPPVHARAGTGFVAALARVGDGVAILLAPERLLDPAELATLSAALESSAEALQVPTPEASGASAARRAAHSPPTGVRSHERTGTVPHPG